MPLCRLVKNMPPGANHFMTADKSEADDAARNLGWKPEGIVCYVSPKQVPHTTPLCRRLRVRATDPQGRAAAAPAVR